MGVTVSPATPLFDVIIIARVFSPYGVDGGQRVVRFSSNVGSLTSWTAPVDQYSK